MPLFALEGARPEIAPNAFVAPTAVLIGRVRLKPRSSVWWGAVLRGDNEWIEVGEGSNVQDNAVCHTDMGAPLTIGADVTVGHGAILHGCTLGDGCLIGMGASVLNHAVVGKGALIGANALVPERKTIAEGMLAVGAPARALRALNEAEIAAIAEGSAGYVANAARYATACQPI